MKAFVFFINPGLSGHSEMRGIVVFVGENGGHFIADFLVSQTKEANFFVADEKGTSVGGNAGGFEHPVAQEDADVRREETLQTSGAEKSTMVENRKNTDKIATQSFTVPRARE